MKKAGSLHSGFFHAHKEQLPATRKKSPATFGKKRCHFFMYTTPLFRAARRLNFANNDRN